MFDDRSLQLLILLFLAGIACCSASPNATRCGHRCDSGECIELDQLCDGKADCLDASDETKGMCEKVWCPGYGFRCSYGACVANTAVCDGTRDCVDGSDEEGWLCRAQMQQANCDNWELYCSSGQCMPYSKLCNGVKDCLGGDDELDSLCEGVVIPTATARSTTVTTEPKAIINSTTAIRRKPSSLEEVKECVVPQLPNVIVKEFGNAVLYAGSKVPNGTRISYDCPADHFLKGEHENLCFGSTWTEKFPYCETPAAFVFSLVITIFSFLIVVLLFFIWRVRRDNSGRRQREEHIWLVETTTAHPPAQPGIPKA
ncbi:hypothetical protein KR059_008328 [Drosophila kikkawai]|nr:hypothetical protein KR059_008328 [Drosophila kikkawai]